MAKEFPTAEHRQSYIDALGREVTSLESRLAQFGGDAAPEHLKSELTASIKAAKAELARLDKATDDGDEKPLEKLKLAELIEHAEKIGIEGDELEALQQKGVTKAEVIAAIQAKTQD